MEKRYRYVLRGLAEVLSHQITKKDRVRKSQIRKVSHIHKSIILFSNCWPPTLNFNSCMFLSNHKCSKNNKERRTYILHRNIDEIDQNFNKDIQKKRFSHVTCWYPNAYHEVYPLTNYRIARSGAFGNVLVCELSFSYSVMLHNSGFGYRCVTKRCLHLSMGHSAVVSHYYIILLYGKKFTIFLFFCDALDKICFEMRAMLIIINYLKTYVFYKILTDLTKQHTSVMRLFFPQALQNPPLISSTISRNLTLILPSESASS